MHGGRGGRLTTKPCAGGRKGTFRAASDEQISRSDTPGTGGGPGAGSATPHPLTQPLPHVGQRLLQGAVAAVTAASLACGAFAILTEGAGPAHAMPRLTVEEQLTIDIFRKSTPSVVNVTNLAVK